MWVRQTHRREIVVWFRQICMLSFSSCHPVTPGREFEIEMHFLTVSSCVLYGLIGMHSSCCAFDRHIGMPISFVLMNLVIVLNRIEFYSIELYSIECAEYYHPTLFLSLPKRDGDWCVDGCRQNGRIGAYIRRLHWQCVMFIRTTSVRALQGLTRGAM